MPARAALRQAVKVAAAAADRLRPPGPGVVVLIYHRVGARTPVEVDLPAGLFEEQMAMLADSGRVATLDDALERLRSAPSTVPDPVAVTFDDGTQDFAEVAVPILAQHQIPATLYVATDFIEQGRSFPDDGRPLSWAALGDTLSTGLVTVGSHTHTHALLDRLDGERAEDELVRSVELIGDRLGVTARHFAYPKAVLGSAGAEDAVRRRFASAALGGGRPNPYGCDPYRLRRSAIQRLDGMRWFGHKVGGGMGLEESLRRQVNRIRYVGAPS